ncbi:hypothetical protein PInf_009167 [Phytophthora infestans]|nr:hypothetical protein PInf_009167 [Phytophthora infestans]
MFSKEVVGSANAVAAGWGNLGAGATYLITPLLFDLITVQGGMSDNSGWRIQVHNVLSLYYFEDFRRFDCDPTIDEDNCRLLTQTKASLISSCFGLMCIFARAIGGYISDIGNRHWDMKGRISTQLVCLTGQAIFLYVYSHIRGVEWSVPCLIAFGFFAQASTGTTYGIVPYICPDYTGVTSGIVGAGGNVGGLMWGLLFKIVEERALSFRYLSFFVMSSAIFFVIVRLEIGLIGSSFVTTAYWPSVMFAMKLLDG